MLEADPINSFTGAEAYLSNFFQSSIRMAGPAFPHPLIFPTAEHAFAAAKTTDFAVRERIANLPTPGDAKRAGRAIQLRPDWDDIRIDVMRSILTLKFKQHPELAARLIGTGDRELVEGNSWGDKFWGRCNRTGVGHNHLGKLLMELRAKLRLTATTETAA